MKPAIVRAFLFCVAKKTSARKTLHRSGICQMAARTLRPRHQDEVRAKIQASNIITRLTKHVHGQVEMSATQVRAAEILLKKSLPDLTQIEGPGEQGEHRITVGWEK